MPVMNTFTLGIYGMVAPPATSTESTADSTVDSSAESTDGAAVVIPTESQSNDVIEI